MKTLLSVAAVLLATSIGSALGQAAYPTQLIRLIVPSPPGGPHEVVVRALAERMSSALGQPVIVENRPGAAGAIGAKAVIAATPDGHTLLVSAPAALVVVPTLYKNPGYDPAKDLIPVATLFSSPQMLVVHPSFQVNSIRDIVAHAKANPGKLNYASPSYGTGPHLLGELFRLTTSTDIVNVLQRRRRVGDWHADRAGAHGLRDRAATAGARSGGQAEGHRGRGFDAVTSTAERPHHGGERIPRTASDAVVGRDGAGRYSAGHC
jgi:hypothetical protein